MTDYPLPAPVRFIVEALCNLAVFSFELAVAASVIAFLMGAFFYLTAGGSHTKVQRAKQTLTYAVLGVVVLVLSWGAVLILAELMGGATPSLKGCIAPSP